MLEISEESLWDRRGTRMSLVRNGIISTSKISLHWKTWGLRLLNNFKFSRPNERNCWLNVLSYRIWTWSLLVSFKNEILFYFCFFLSWHLTIVNFIYAPFSLTLTVVQELILWFNHLIIILHVELKVDSHRYIYYRVYRLVCVVWGTYLSYRLTLVRPTSVWGPRGNCKDWYCV